MRDQYDVQFAVGEEANIFSLHEEVETNDAQRGGGRETEGVVSQFIDDLIGKPLNTKMNQEGRRKK